MRLLRKVALIALALAVPASLSAQTDIHFGSNTVDDAVKAYGTYVGPYNASLGGEAIDFFCIDFDNHLYLGNTYDVTVSPLMGMDAKFAKAAWLTTKFATEATSQWKYIHGAIWQLAEMSPTFSPSASDQAEIDTWIALAGASGFSGAGFAYLDLEGSVQDGIYRVPEPGTVILLLTGLLSLGFVALPRRLL